MPRRSVSRVPKKRGTACTGDARTKVCRSSSFCTSVIGKGSRQTTHIACFNSPQPLQYLPARGISTWASSCPTLAGKRDVARKVLSKTWRGCLQLHPRVDCSNILLRQRDLAQASGFFRECPGFEDDDASSPATSVSDVCLLIPTSARLSRGARALLPDVLLWLVGTSRLPLGVAMVFVDQDLRPVALRSHLGSSY